MDAIKLNENTIQISKQAEAPAPVVKTYTYDFLAAQKARIIEDANNYLAARQKELDEVNALIAQCDGLGISAQAMPSPIEQKPAS